MSDGALAADVVAAPLADAAPGDGTDDAGDAGIAVDAGPLSVTVANAHDGRATSSGFVVGSASGSGLSVVLVSLDLGQTWAAASGTASWSFPLPTGASTWPVGSTHGIWVRASDGANSSATTERTVRAGRNEDVNGDGYADLVVGAPGEPSAGGAASVFYSRGPSGVGSAVHAETTLTGSTDDFGFVVLLADIDADGYADVVVADDTAGAVYVFHSSGAAGIASGSFSTAALTFTGPPPSSDSFGYSVAVGDVNGDGYPDVVVGDPYGGSSAGAVYVFQSVSGAQVAGAAFTSATVTFAGAAGAQFGRSVALGDANGDGRLDLLVGAWELSHSDGAAYLFVADASGLGDVTAPSATLSGANGCGFGVFVALSDLNGDGYADAVVAAPLPGSMCPGAAYVFQSTGTGGIASTSDSAATASLTGLSPVGFSAGDTNGDGYDDLVVGVPGGDVAYVFAGSASGVTNAACAQDGAPCVGAAATLSGRSGALFGASVVATDLDGDGYADVVVGASEASVGNGTGGVYIFTSTGSGGTPSATYTAASATLGGSASAYFGHSVD